MRTIEVKTDPDSVAAAPTGRMTMDVHDFLERKRELLNAARSADAEAQLCRDELSLLEDEFKLAGSVTAGQHVGKRQSKIARFMAENRERLSAEDIELLQKPARTPQEIESIIGESAAKVRARLRANTYRPGRGDNPTGRRMVCTISLVEHLIESTE